MQIMISRLFQQQVVQKLRRYPAVALIGPRQCGKTTLARQLGGIYFDLEEEGSLTRLNAEWNTLVKSRKLIVLDEVQHAPAVLSRLRGAIDADRKRNGRFLLLGSVSPALMESASESLAGRLGLVPMSPFLLAELSTSLLAEPSTSLLDELSTSLLDELWLKGGYPDGGILEPDRFPEWQDDFLEILVTRDLPTWGLPTRPPKTRRLLRMLAAVHGQPLNGSQLGASLSLDHKTILGYCDFLEGAFLVRRLEPFLTNIRKRLVKTPRLYWRDSGLLHALLGVTSFDQLYRQPWLGASWEGFVIEQTIATLAASNRRAQPFFFRTSDGHELDLVLDWGTERWAVEIKLTSDPTTTDVGKLHRAADMLEAKHRFLVCRVANEIENTSLLVTHVPGWLARLAPVSVSDGLG